jgi:hypothetical protein
MNRLKWNDASPVSGLILVLQIIGIELDINARS